LEEEPVARVSIIPSLPLPPALPPALPPSSSVLLHAEDAISFYSYPYYYYSSSSLYKPKAISFSPCLSACLSALTPEVIKKLVKTTTQKTFRKSQSLTNQTLGV
jgi:hypothetical protein